MSDTPKSVCRVGDIGTGVCHLHGTPQEYTTTFTEAGSFGNLFEGEIGGVKFVTIGTLGNASCGHQTIAITGGTSTCGGSGGLHRVGDTGHIVGSPESVYTATTGSDTFRSI